LEGTGYKGLRRHAQTVYDDDDGGEETARGVDPCAHSLGLGYSGAEKEWGRDC